MRMKLTKCVILLFFIFTCVISSFCHKTCLVCKKNIDKKADRKTPPSAEVLLQCFGVTYNEDSTTETAFIFSTCLRNVFTYKKTGKTFSYVSTAQYALV